MCYRWEFMVFFPCRLRKLPQKTEELTGFQCFKNLWNTFSVLTFLFQVLEKVAVASQRVVRASNPTCRGRQRARQWAASAVSGSPPWMLTELGMPESLVTKWSLPVTAAAQAKYTGPSEPCLPVSYLHLDFTHRKGTVIN